MFTVPVLALATTKLSIVPAPEFISNAKLPAPLIVPISWAVMVLEDTVIVPLFKSNVPSISAPEFNVNAPSTTVVPLPLIAFAKLPVALNVPVFAIAPPKLSILLVNVPLLLTSPTICPYL